MAVSRVNEFGPIALQTVMARMVANGWAHTTVNRQAGRIKRLFKWGVSQEIIPASIYHALSTVSGLRKGRTEAHETDPVLPVADTVVDTTLVHLPEVVADMVRFQRLTGCRPEEVCAVRPCDVDRSNDIWQYRPQSHKTEHHNRERVILIGPQAQAVLLKYLARDGQMYCFRPMDSEAKRRAVCPRSTHYAAVARQSAGHEPQVQAAARAPGEQYDVDAYRRAIARACDTAFPHPTLSAIPKAKLTAEQLAELKKWQSAHRWSAKPTAAYGGDRNPPAVRFGGRTNRVGAQQGGRHPGLRRARPSERHRDRATNRIDTRLRMRLFPSGTSLFPLKAAGWCTPAILWASSEASAEYENKAQATRAIPFRHGVRVRVCAWISAHLANIGILQ